MYIDCLHPAAHEVIAAKVFNFKHVYEPPSRVTNDPNPTTEHQKWTLNNKLLFVA